jgi:hypothetical protein
VLFRSNRYTQKLLKHELPVDSGGSTTGQKGCPTVTSEKVSDRSWAVLPVVGSTGQLQPDAITIQVTSGIQKTNLWNLSTSRVVLLVTGSTNNHLSEPRFLRVSLNTLKSIFENKGGCWAVLPVASSIGQLLATSRCEGTKGAGQ